MLRHLQRRASEGGRSRVSTGRGAGRRETERETAGRGQAAREPEPATPGARAGRAAAPEARRAGRGRQKGDFTIVRLYRAL